MKNNCTNINVVASIYMFFWPVKLQNSIQTQRNDLSVAINLFQRKCPIHMIYNEKLEHATNPESFLSLRYLV